MGGGWGRRAQLFFVLPGAWLFRLTAVASTIGAGGPGWPPGSGTYPVQKRLVAPPAISPAPPTAQVGVAGLPALQSGPLTDQLQLSSSGARAPSPPPAHQNYVRADGLQIATTSTLPPLDPKATAMLWSPPYDPNHKPIPLNDYPVPGVHPFAAYQAQAPGYNMTPDKAQKMAEDGQYDELQKQHLGHLMHRVVEPGLDVFNRYFGYASPLIQETGAVLAVMSLVEGVGGARRIDQWPKLFKPTLQYMEKLVKNQNGKESLFITKALSSGIKKIGGPREGSMTIWNAASLPRSITSLFWSIAQGQPLGAWSNILKFATKAMYLSPKVKAATPAAIARQQLISSGTGSLLLLSLYNINKVDSLRNNVNIDLGQQLHKAGNYRDMAAAVLAADAERKRVEREDVPRYKARHGWDHINPIYIVKDAARGMYEPVKEAFAPDAKSKARRTQRLQDLKAGLKDSVSGKGPLEASKSAIQFLSEEKALNSPAAYGFAGLLLTASGLTKFVAVPAAVSTGIRALSEGIGGVADLMQAADEYFVKGYKLRGALLGVGTLFDRSRTVVSWNMDKKSPWLFPMESAGQAAQGLTTNMYWVLRAIDEGGSSKKSGKGGDPLLTPQSWNIPQATARWDGQHTAAYHQKTHKALKEGTPLAEKLPEAELKKARFFAWRDNLASVVKSANRSRVREGSPPIELGPLVEEVRRQRRLQPPAPTFAASAIDDLATDSDCKLGAQNLFKVASP
jgi:hypothetical protein